MPLDPSSLDALPEDAILVHLGPHKTGTTAVQSALENSRAVLAQHNVHYPPTAPRMAHHRAASALLQHPKGWARELRDAPSMREWERFAARVVDFPGRVVISSELLAEADNAARDRLVRDLGPERVHLVVGARNPASIALSTWQQVVRTYGGSHNLNSWLELAFRRDLTAEAASRFWRRADTAALVARWGEAVPNERITVIALDEGNRRLLPGTFEQLLGLPSGLLADHEAVESNRGLTAMELTLIRRVNALLYKKLSWADYRRLVPGGLIKHLIAARSPGPDEVKVPLPDWAAEQALVEAERNIDGLRSSGVRIVGDLASLRVIPARTGRLAPITEVPIELAAETVAGAVLAAARVARPAGQAATPAAKPLRDVPTSKLVAVLARRLRRRARRIVRRRKPSRTPGR